MEPVGDSLNEGVSVMGGNGGLPTPHQRKKGGADICHSPLLEVDRSSRPGLQTALTHRRRPYSPPVVGVDSPAASTRAEGSSTLSSSPSTVDEKNANIISA